MHNTCVHANASDQILTDWGQHSASWSSFLRSHDQSYNHEDVSNSLPGITSRQAPKGSCEGHDESDTVIGTALKNGRFKCAAQGCGSKSFNRLPELRRHYNTVHAAKKPEFWCDVQCCTRSAAAGSRPFHRRYRLMDHMRTMHKRNSCSSNSITEVQK
jgi:hypothetical protein